MRIAKPIISTGVKQARFEVTLPGDKLRGRTWTGTHRSHNEDAFLMMHRLDPQADTRIFAAAVADGMGGITAGEESSCIAIQTFENYLMRMSVSEFPEQSPLEGVMREADQAVGAFRASLGQKTGTTFTAILGDTLSGKVYAAQVGDSPIFKYSAQDQVISQLFMNNSSPSHYWDTKNNRGKDSFPLTDSPEEMYSPLASYYEICRIGLDANRLFNALRGNAFVPDPRFPYKYWAPRFGEFSARPGDRFFLCSDGLSGDKLRFRFLASILRSGKSLAATVDDLFDAVPDPGDNITLAGVEV